jgi:hypothetical protein
MLSAGTKDLINSISVPPRYSPVPRISNPVLRTEAENPNIISVRSTLKALCSLLPEFSGSPFLIIRRYAVFVPRKKPAASPLIRDRDKRITGTANIVE